MENNTNKNEKTFDKAFAMAWNEHQGGYSQNLAKKFLKFIKLQDLNVNTVLDVCCGSANFLSEMKANGKMCTGTEILDTYVEYNSKLQNLIGLDKNKNPSGNFYQFTVTNAKKIPVGEVTFVFPDAIDTSKITIDYNYVYY